MLVVAGKHFGFLAEPDDRPGPKAGRIDRREQHGGFRPEIPPTVVDTKGNICDFLLVLSKYLQYRRR